MSMVQQLISSVTNAERQIDDQLMKLRTYISEIDRVSLQVQNTLGGSQQDYAQKMLSQLVMTKSEVEETINRLQASKNKLVQLRMI